MGRPVIISPPASNHPAPVACGVDSERMLVQCEGGCHILVSTRVHGTLIVIDRTAITRPAAESIARIRIGREGDALSRGKCLRAVARATDACPCHCPTAFWTDVHGQNRLDG